MGGHPTPPVRACFFRVIRDSVCVSLWSRADQDQPDEPFLLKGMFQNGGSSPPSPARQRDKRRKKDR